MAIKRKIDANMIIESKKLKATIDQSQPKTSEALFQETLNLVSSSLFRVLTPHCPTNAGIKYGESFYIDKNTPSMHIKDPSWPKLELVYDVFTKLIESPEVDASLLSSCIKNSFIRKLIGLFQSEDGNERDALLSVLNIAYIKSDTHHRKLIRTSVFNEFYSFIVSANVKHNGISELLLFLLDIVEYKYEDVVEFQQDFRVFLVRGLIPLYKSNWLALFYSDLNNLVGKLVRRNSRHAVTVIQGLLKHWPVAGSAREYFFLEGVEDVLWELAQPNDDLKDAVIPLFRRIAVCLSSPHLKVAEKGLSLFTMGGNIQLLIEMNLDVILPIIFTDLEIDAKNHWCVRTQKLAREVGDYLLNCEPELYKECRMLWGL